MLIKNKEEYILEMNNLIDMLNYNTQLYDEGKPVISDKEWDEMYFRLQYLEASFGIYLPGSPTQKVNYTLVNELKKVKHNHPMLSLDKTKDWHEFLHYFSSQDPSKDVVGMLKMDGLTCSLKYSNGMLVAAETRGNGEIGEDILHNAQVIKNIPKRIDYKYDLILDGEIICTYQDFEEFSKDYANPRNFAAGSIRLLDNKECEKRKLQFIAWNVVQGPYKKVIDNFNTIKKLGFTVVPWTSSFDWDAKDFLIEQAKELGYPIDGLVGRFNDMLYGESLGSTDHHSKAAYAFKFYDEEYGTWLRDIEWTMGRTGTLTPVAIFHTVDTGDSLIERASLHNISVMKETLGTPYQGQSIVVCKMNEIIPQVLSGGIPECKADIEGLEFKIPTECPVCGAPLIISCEADSEILKCINPECEGQLLNRLDHFCGKKGLDIKGLSKATLTKLINWGWVNEPADLYKLNNHAKEWKKKAGFGERSVENILNAIEASRSPKLASFICALGIPHVGKTLSKELVKYFNSYDEFKEAAINQWDFTQIDGIAIEKASAIWSFNFTEADNVDEFILSYENDKITTTIPSLAGMSICITGRLTKFANRNALQEEIEKRGGKVVSGVSNNTTLLINNDINSNSSKNNTAKQLGINIITEEEFFNTYLDN